MRRRRRGAGDPTAVRCECARADAVACSAHHLALDLFADSLRHSVGVHHGNRVDEQAELGAESVQAAYHARKRNVARTVLPSPLQKNKVYLVELYRLCLLSPPSTRP